MNTNITNDICPKCGATMDSRIDQTSDGGWVLEKYCECGYSTKDYSVSYSHRTNLRDNYGEINKKNYR